MDEMSFRVPGMTCGHCVKSITTEIRKVEGISGVEIDQQCGWVVVRGTSLVASTITDAITKAGYEVEM